MLEHKEILNFRAFLRLIASMVWSTISVSQLTEQIWVPRYTVEKYLYVLENTFLLHQIRPRHKGRVKNEKKKQAKVYFSDTGMLRYLLGVQERIGTHKGTVVENFVCTELMTYKRGHQELMYRGTNTWGEVDFILENQAMRTIIPVEVKSGNKTNLPRSFSHFMKNHDDLIEHWYVTTHKTLTQRDNVTFLPYTQISTLYHTSS